MKTNEFVTVQLSNPTAFPDLNRLEGKDKDFVRESINVKRLKFKLFREMSALPPERQIIFAISKLTDMSENDIDELYTEDAAAVTKVVIGFMRSFIEITQDLMHTEGKG